MLLQLCFSMFFMTLPPNAKCVQCKIANWVWPSMHFVTIQYFDKTSYFQYKPYKDWRISSNNAASYGAMQYTLIIMQCKIRINWNFRNIFSLVQARSLLAICECLTPKSEHFFFVYEKEEKNEWKMEEKV